jgi:hypothetical protein
MLGGISHAESPTFQVSFLPFYKAAPIFRFYYTFCHGKIQAIFKTVVSFQQIAEIARVFSGKKRHFEHIGSPHVALPAGATAVSGRPSLR